MPRVATHSDSEESSQSKSNVLKDINGAQDEGEEEDDEPEYEIEEVLDAKRGVFPDGRMGYFVKWKGYGPKDNSWVDEMDVINAKDVVEEFWKKNPQKKRSVDRKSLDKRSPDKGRKSIVADDSSDAVEAKPKKRGRKSAARKTNSDDEMSVNQPEPRATKRAKRNQSIRAQSETSEGPEKEDKIIGNMKNYMHLTSWEGVVSSVDTVERSDVDNLTVYFTLNTGECVMETNEICNSRFPQKLLKFYESNLKWKGADEDF